MAESDEPTEWPSALVCPRCDGPLEPSPDAEAGAYRCRSCQVIWPADDVLLEDEDP